MVKDYNIIKGNVFPKPYDKKGLKIKLEEKKAADYVKKGALEEMNKPKKVEKKENKPKKVDK